MQIVAHEGAPLLPERLLQEAHLTLTGIANKLLNLVKIVSLGRKLQFGGKLADLDVLHADLFLDFNLFDVSFLEFLRFHLQLFLRAFQLLLQLYNLGLERHSNLGHLFHVLLLLLLEGFARLLA